MFMPDGIRNNIVHAILKLLSTGEKYSWEPSELANRITPWYKIKKYSIHIVNNACRIIKKEGILHELSSGTWVMTGHIELRTAREIYDSGKYKEPIAIWVWPARIGAALVGFATIYGIIDGSQSKNLQNKINKQQLELELLRQKRVQDSIVMDSVFHLSKKRESDSLKTSSSHIKK